VTDPGLTEVANGSHHTKASGKDTGMSNDTVSRLKHALHLPTVSTLGKSLKGRTKVTEGSILLNPLALVTLHGTIAGLLHNISVLFPRPDVLLSEFLLLRLFPRSSFFLRHDDLPSGIYETHFNTSPQFKLTK
jgi:hypothetical protein